MKRKIGTIYNKPIVTGDKNLVTKNEVHESNLGGSSGSSSSDMEYYSTSLEKVQTLGIGDAIMGSIPLVKGSFQQPGLDETKLISGGGIFCILMFNNLGTLKLYGIGFTKIKKNNNEYNSFKDFFSDIISEVGGDPNIFDTVFTPITKEEFYDLNNI